MLLHPHVTQGNSPFQASALHLLKERLRNSEAYCDHVLTQLITLGNRAKEAMWRSEAEPGHQDLSLVDSASKVICLLFMYQQEWIGYRNQLIACPP